VSLPAIGLGERDKIPDRPRREAFGTNMKKGKLQKLQMSETGAKSAIGS